MIFGSQAATLVCGFVPRAEQQSANLRLVGAERCCPKVSVCSGCAENLPCWDLPLVPQWEKLGRGGGTGGEVGLELWVPLQIMAK